MKCHKGEMGHFTFIWHSLSALYLLHACLLQLEMLISLKLFCDTHFQLHYNGDLQKRIARRQTETKTETNSPSLATKGCLSKRGNCVKHYDSFYSAGASLHIRLTCMVSRLYTQVSGLYSQRLHYRTTRGRLGNTLPTLRKPCWMARIDGVQIVHSSLLSYVKSI